MAYFLRFTNTAQKDLQRGTSLHFSDLQASAVSKSRAAELFGCETSELKKVNGVWCQVLDGLCGYQLQASTIEEAIEEVEEGGYQFDFVGRPVIFSGKYSQNSDLVPDGDLFHAFSIAKEL